MEILPALGTAYKRPVIMEAEMGIEPAQYTNLVPNKINQNNGYILSDTSLFY